MYVCTSAYHEQERSCTETFLKYVSYALLEIEIELGIAGKSGQERRGKSYVKY
jgi:hypothetical protein